MAGTRAVAYISPPFTSKHIQTRSIFKPQRSWIFFGRLFRIKHLLVVILLPALWTRFWSQAQVRWSDYSKLLSAFSMSFHIYYMSQMVNRFSLITVGALFTNTLESMLEHTCRKLRGGGIQHRRGYNPQRSIWDTWCPHSHTIGSSYMYGSSMARWGIVMSGNHRSRKTSL